MQRSDFYYELPKELIAQTPLDDRLSSRLLILDKKTGETSHSTFKNILSEMSHGDVLVLNDTRVIPARLIGIKEDTGVAVEFLLLSKKALGVWEAIVKPGRRLKQGTKVSFGDGKLRAEILDVINDGNRLVKFYYDGVFEEILDELGNVPLPPYITEKLNNKERYQTVYSKNEGSAAAPTAGLHFTKDFLEQIEQKGVNIAYLTLHVGLGTFRPVKIDNILEHKMHSEYYNLSENSAEIINNAKQSGNKIICVGTTSVRVVETLANDNGVVKADSGWTNIFIYPGYKFKCVDKLITNFHLPESTLIMLVSALAGRDNVLHAYNEAVKEKYRFFSFGDAMMIK